MMSELKVVIRSIDTDEYQYVATNDIDFSAVYATSINSVTTKMKNALKKKGYFVKLTDCCIDMSGNTVLKYTY